MVLIGLTGSVCSSYICHVVNVLYNDSGAIIIRNIELRTHTYVEINSVLTSYE